MPGTLLTNTNEHPGLWRRYAGHRRRLMQHISSCSGEQPQSVCILGAGSCADFDLSELSRMFREVHLLDLDAAAVKKGVQNQQLEDRANIFIHDDTDVTGFNAQLEEWAKQAPAEEKIDAEITRLAAQSPLEKLAGRFDLVISACMMSQLFLAANKCLLPEDDRNRLVFALRRQHLRLLLDLAKQNGVSLLVTDMSAFETKHDFSATTGFDGHETMLQAIRERNFFTGTNPFAVMNEIKREAQLVTRLKDAVFLSPWPWQLFEDRVYLVYALALLKK